MDENVLNSPELVNQKLEEIAQDYLKEKDNNNMQSLHQSLSAAQREWLGSSNPLHHSSIDYYYSSPLDTKRTPIKRLKKYIQKYIENNQHLHITLNKSNNDNNNHKDNISSPYLPQYIPHPKVRFHEIDWKGKTHDQQQILLHTILSFLSNQQFPNNNNNTFNINTENNNEQSDNIQRILSYLAINIPSNEEPMMKFCIIYLNKKSYWLLWSYHRFLMDRYRVLSSPRISISFTINSSYKL